MKLSLPIDSLLPQITEHLTEKSNLILQASPGSGKTTRVPPALLKMIPEGKEIWVLVPRRLAAKAAARRMAEELGENVGETVGYQFRFETVTSAKTQIRLMTEGLFPKLLRQDPQLKKVGAVILDEFHERHLHTDTALGLLKNIQNKNRPDLKIIVMSATIETEKLAQYLSSSVITLESPIYPLEISYLPHIPQGRLDDLVFQTLQTIQKKNLAGDVLVFLPGFADIRRCEKKLIGQFQNTKILSLYGDLSKEEQDLVFQKISERKIILSTNIAESSLTIPGVSIVIDSGWHRQASFSHWSGIPSLKTRPISQASAIQRAGRAARMGPGVCFRLYTRSDFEGRTPFEKPEILRADLSQMILELKSLHNFPLDWFENPPAQHVQTSLNLLCQLGAVDSDLLTSSLTKEGSEMADLPLHPRLSRMLLEAKKRECLSEAIQLAALMSEGDFQSLDVMEELKRDDWDFETKKLIQSLTTTLIASPTKKFLSENLAQSLLSAFSDRVAQKRVRSQEVELVLCQGGTASLLKKEFHNPFLQEAAYFLVLDVQETDKVLARSLVALKPEWLLEDHNPLFSETQDVVWDRESVITKQSIRYGQLILDETILKGPDHSEKSSECLLMEGLGFPKEGNLDVHQWIELFGKVVDREILESLMVRLDLFKSQNKTDLWGSDFLMALAKKLVAGASSLKELRSRDLLTEIKMEFLEDISLLDRWLPTTFLLPNKHKTKIHYAWGKDPWIESKLQDFLGMKEVPKILNGKISLTLHLLAPNRRPVQVTKDLASFWKNTYPEVRKELSRRYPRHPWPENPS